MKDQIELRKSHFFLLIPLALHFTNISNVLSHPFESIAVQMKLQPRVLTLTIN